MLPSIKVRTFLWKQVHVIKRPYQAAAKIPDLTKVGQWNLKKKIIIFSLTVQIYNQDRYQVKRGDFSQVTDADVGHFQSMLENSRVLLDETDTQSYNIDFMKSVRGKNSIFLFPIRITVVTEKSKFF